jgi:hypothetical protein
VPFPASGARSGAPSLSLSRRLSVTFAPASSTILHAQLLYRLLHKLCLLESLVSERIHRINDTRGQTDPDAVTRGSLHLRKDLHLPIPILSFSAWTQGCPRCQHLTLGLSDNRQSDEPPYLLHSGGGILVLTERKNHLCLRKSAHPLALSSKSETLILNPNPSCLLV